jgi:hypothetical protein
LGEHKNPRSEERGFFICVHCNFSGENAKTTKGIFGGFFIGGDIRKASSAVEGYLILPLILYALSKLIFCIAV